MQILNVLYQNPPKNIKFIDRKLTIDSSKTIIIGANASGKTSLVIDYLKKFKNEESLYINLNDIRVDKSEILENLISFLKINSNVKIVAIDNLDSQITADNFYKILKDNVENIIFTTNKKSIKLEEFKSLILHFLDYEEFIAFFHKNLDQDALFSHFLSRGRSVTSALLDISEVNSYLQNILKENLDDMHINLLKECVAFQGQSLSVYELYKRLKERIKISKDSVYASLGELEESGYISLVAKFNEPNATKRLYFEDFALRNALSFKKDFTKNFTNVIFCELFKFEEQIFYTKEIDFFLAKKKLAIICVPFSAPEIVFLKFKKLHASLKELGISKLQIISVANQAEQSIEGIKCEILPFSRWSLGL